VSLTLIRRRRRFGLSAALVVGAAAVLIALTWFGALSASQVEEREAQARVEGEVANQALLFEGQFRRELLVLDQTLRILEHEWEANPSGFNLADWRQRALVLPDLSLHVFISDAQGIIRASTRPELIGVDISGRDYFRYEAGLPRDTGQMFIGPSTRGLVTNRWQMNMARRLDGPDGEFRGVMAVSYDTNSLTRFYRQADLGDNGLIAIVGVRDGRLRALVGPPAVQPDRDISGTEMMTALRADPNGRWTGPSATDGVTRIHAFRAVPDRDLAVVLAFDAPSALRSSQVFVDGAHVFAEGTTLFILVFAVAVLRGIRGARRRESRLQRDRAVLAAANAELDAARRQADAKTAQLEVTLASMSDGVSVLDGDLRLVAWNTLFAELSGVPVAALKVGAAMTDLLRAQALAGEFGPVDTETEVARRMQLLRSGASIGTMEHTRPDGRTLEMRRTALSSGGYVTLYTDITDRKQGEEAMRQARELAEAAAAAKSRFVATVSHEIRTPLNALLNSLHLLADTRVSDTQKRLVDMARQAGDGLLGLIDDILEMSKMEAGKLVLRPNLFALRPLLQGLTTLFHDEGLARGIGFSVRLEPDVPEFIYGDAARVRQVLINLVSNAVKFSSPGTVCLLARIELHQGQERLRLAVRDPGPALSVADRARIFQPFSRLDRSQLTPAPGTGLGLTICHTLATLMEGEIGCYPSGEGGNEFWLSLPVDAVKSRVPAFGAPKGPLPRTRILLVEDMPANQLVTAALLRREGHMVDVAASGEAALQMAEAAPYDIIFMDVRMPGMSGLEATRRIRALNSPSGAAPIIALTANVDPDDRMRSRAAGMDDLVAKPVEIGRLNGMIARYVWPARATAEEAERPVGRAEAGPAPTLSADRIAELRTNLTPATLLGLAQDCLGELRRRLPDLDAALAAGDVEGIVQETHAMGGLAVSYGLASLHAQLRAIEIAARSGAMVMACASGESLGAELDRAAPALLAALGEELVES
jgi:signal transduction histidine kinase/ActR/RegA family two-component response regulator